MGEKIMAKAIGRRSLEFRKDGDNVKLLIWLERMGEYKVLAQPVLTLPEAQKLSIALNGLLKAMSAAAPDGSRAAAQPPGKGPQKAGVQPAKREGTSR